MKIVLQRVDGAEVKVEGITVGKIGKGYAVFLGIGQGDTELAAEKMADKISRLRIFADENGKTNLSAAEAGGEILIIPQFTLMADCGQNRPSFSRAAEAGLAKELYEYFIGCCKDKFVKAASGQFGAHMHVECRNDGPFTLVLEG